MRRRIRILAVLLGVAIVIPAQGQHTAGRGEFGLYVSAAKLVGDQTDDASISPAFGLTIGVSLSDVFLLEFEGGLGWNKPRDVDASGLNQWIKIRPGTPFKTNLYPVLANLRINIQPERKFNPYALVGAGLLFWDLEESDESVHGSQTNFMGNLGLGFEAFLSEAVGLDVSLRYQRLFGQDKDMSGYGDAQTGNLEARMGLNFYLGGPKDSDGDGILDRMDACPEMAEDFDGFEDLDGCPDPDNDGDGIPDAMDLAPLEAEDVDGFEDQDGIPDPDNDGDGIRDLDDRAPNEPEDMDGFQDGDGAPDPDNDEDGIPDTEDGCPDEAETFNDFEDADGCPDEEPELEMVAIEETAPIVLEGVTFASNSSVLSNNAKTILEAVYNTLEAYPEMRVEIRGHTDNTGNADYNLWLSQRRAESVLEFLVSKNIGVDRLRAVGFGEVQPIATNDTETGRNTNRRIEFIRIE